MIAIAVKTWLAASLELLVVSDPSGFPVSFRNTEDQETRGCGCRDILKQNLDMDICREHLIDCLFRTWGTYPEGGQNYV